jgi:hypothetical protein
MQCDGTNKNAHPTRMRLSNRKQTLSDCSTHLANEHFREIISNMIKELHESNAFTNGMTLPGPLYIPTAHWKSDDEWTSNDTTTLCHIVGKTTQNVVWENTIPPGDRAPISPFFIKPTHNRWKSAHILICPQLSIFPDDTSVLAIVSPNVPYPEFRPNTFSKQQEDDIMKGHLPTLFSFF